ncbi:hypothetical protein GCM10009554_57990 [Kribbella koreensis]|uniref:HTH tetR-type domain-containing protein n=1 Tax=Kribbella koreensis TaxID=57909 RepID=A0ABP4BQJ7_9ACTN
MAAAESRRPRADATRNRQQLLDVATRMFAAAETEPSMRAIAVEAGVGIATLYRHFPTRESLVDAVYRDQVSRLTTGARELLTQLDPATALRRWMDLFGDWIATKNGMIDTLVTMIESGDLPHADTRAELLAAIDHLLEAGRATGQLRPDVPATDIAATLIGIFTVAGSPDQQPMAARLLDLLLTGLRPATPDRLRAAPDRPLAAPDRPEIVCICGSIRFADEMQAANRALTIAGAIVLAPAVSARPDDPLTPEQKTALGALHLRKIDLADRVLVVNPGGYLGESTTREIAHARTTGKPISFTDPPEC